MIEKIKYSGDAKAEPRYVEVAFDVASAELEFLASIGYFDVKQIVTEQEAELETKKSDVDDQTTSKVLKEILQRMNGEMEGDD